MDNVCRVFAGRFRGQPDGSNRRFAGAPGQDGCQQGNGDPAGKRSAQHGLPRATLKKRQKAIGHSRSVPAGERTASGIVMGLGQRMHR
ncbi:hypothetical protein NY78_3357 [Desulfovibrio sp. TomC]|nr:hypothetical protein NY78_3357 [Desulfovibrio sp. TomC]